MDPAARDGASGMCGFGTGWGDLYRTYQYFITTILIMQDHCVIISTRKSHMSVVLIVRASSRTGGSLDRCRCDVLWSL